MDTKIRLFFFSIYTHKLGQKIKFYFVNAKFENNNFQIKRFKIYQTPSGTIIQWFDIDRTILFKSFLKKLC